MESSSAARDTAPAMSERNVELVLGGFRLFKPDDLKDWEALWHPESQATASEGWPEKGPFHGRQEIMRQVARLFAEWSEYHFDQLEVAAGSGDWVLLTWRLRTRGAVSGIETDFAQATAYRVQEGKIVEAHFRRDLAAALEAAGLSD
jgi:ketosteroid isomerase-like protein